MATHEEVVARWIEEAGRGEAARYLRGSGMFVDEEGQLRFTTQGYGWDPERNGYRHARGTEEYGLAEGIEVPILARFVGERHNGGFVLLNGDGFNDSVPLTRRQTILRNQVRTTFPNRNMLVPFAALRAAGVVLDTIKPIDVTDDQNINENHFIFDEQPQVSWFASTESIEWSFPTEMAGVTPQPVEEIQMLVGRRRIGVVPFQRWAEIRRGGYRLRITQSHASRIDITGVALDNPNLSSRYFVWAPDFVGRQAWRHITEMYDGERESYRWGWVEAIHRLGASLFSGEGPDGRRHKYVSAFDQNEQNPLYFLAQLPDGSGAKSYTDALNALAPPIVHRAREEGKIVLRQGDVFAIQSIASDEEVYGRAVTRVRRVIALQEEIGFPGRRRVRPPAEGEVAEAIPCPHCQRPRRDFQGGHGPKARAALSIFGTGHTADEVVVCKGGVTFIRGSLYHDPRLEDPTRRDPDHQPIQLGNGTEWFLAVRNTVPRQRMRRRRRTSDDAAEQQTQEEPTDVRGTANVGTAGHA